MGVANFLNQNILFLLQLSFLVFYQNQ